MLSLMMMIQNVFFEGKVGKVRAWISCFGGGSFEDLEMKVLKLNV